MNSEGEGNLVGATVVFEDKTEGVIRHIYMKPVAYNWLGRVVEAELTAVVRDASGDLVEEPVEGLKLKMATQGLSPADNDITVTHVTRTVIPPDDPCIRL